MQTCLFREVVKTCILNHRSHNAHPWACAWREPVSRFVKEFFGVPPHQPAGLCSRLWFKAFSSLENRIVYSTKGLFMDTLLDWIVFFGRNWSRQESCSFAYTVLVAFRAEPIRMASVQTHSCVSQPCQQLVVITLLSCSSLSWWLRHGMWRSNLQMFKRLM